MSEKEIYSRLEEVFSDVFDEDISLTAATTADDIEDWDSIEHINLIGAVEDEKCWRDGKNYSFTC